MEVEGSPGELEVTPKDIIDTVDSEVSSTTSNCWDELQPVPETKEIFSLFNQIDVWSAPNT